ncbi:MAG: hypothetical protein JW800_02445 [Candidatus Omnitrophica bacterium]|nr:hypothetical protein [Candidatus Omnitrophota bacterium]
MKKYFFALLILMLAASAAIVIFFPVYQDSIATKGHQEWSDLDKVYQWLCSNQRANRKYILFHTGLLPSHEGGEDCFVYDQALAAFAFTHHGDYQKAKAIFNFFDGVRERHIKKYGNLIGFTDTYKRDGRETETRAAGPNAWVLMALNYYMYKTNDKSFLPLARDLADWLISLQCIDGGCIGGYYGNGKPMTWVSTEHNFDCYAGFRDLGILTADDKYLKKAKEVKRWLVDDVWNEENKRFFLGKNNPNFATDLSSWAVLSLGIEYAPSLDFAMDKSLNTQTYKVKNVKVEGFDFGSDYKRSPFPDKDAVWFEGTAHMVLAFSIAGREKESDYYLDQIRNCLTDSPTFPYTMGLPYASNEGTPVYDSWMMQDKPLCISSTTWYYFAENKFNPFSATGELELANQIIDKLDYDGRCQFMPVIDDFECSDIKFCTAYPEDLIFTKKAKLFTERSDEIVVDGIYSLGIEFIPDDGAKVATAALVRKFLYPQDWSTYDTLSLWVYSNGTSGNNNIATFNIKDREGEVYISPPIFLNRSGWRKYIFNLWEDFERSSYDGVTYGDNMFGLSRIIEMSFTLRSKHPVENSKIYIDRIELQKEKEEEAEKTVL